ncbi:MAG: hypothetical protein ACREUT_10235 [Steroidobacteraceae bacterium]
MLESYARESRIALLLPDERIAWFPTSADGARLLRKERRVLRLLEKHCRFSAARVLYEDETGWELRQFVPGAVRPSGLRDRIQHDAAFAYRFGEDLGRILAEQHTSIPATALEGWLPSIPNWPRPEDLPHLPHVVQSASLLERINTALEGGLPSTLNIACWCMPTSAFTTSSLIRKRYASLV